MAGSAILLVEHDDGDAEELILALRYLHIRNGVVRVCDGAEALDYLFARGNYVRRKSADLPLLAIVALDLPLMSGQELVGAIRDNDNTKSLPILLLSDPREQSRGVGPQLLKPASGSAFMAAIGELNLYWSLGE